MFGFIVAPCRSCGAVEYPVWRGVFCGVARELAFDYGPAARLLANRDAAFLALIGLGLDPGSPHWIRATCCNPFGHPFPVPSPHPATGFAAAVSVCGLAAKLEDDHSDEKWPRRLIARAGLRLGGAGIDRAVAWLNGRSFPTAGTIAALASQNTVEGNDPLNAEAPTARAFGTITAFLGTLLEVPSAIPELRRLGEAHGRLVYWRDAWDDRTADRKAGRFNPFLLQGAEALRPRFDAAWRDFREALAALPLRRHLPLLSDIGGRTEEKRRRLEEENCASRREKRRRERELRKDKRPSCWSSCDCCDCLPSCGGRSGKACTIDSCFDCGPGDTGCCDCCPCDGCNCCP